MQISLAMQILHCLLNIISFFSDSQRLINSSYDCPTFPATFPYQQNLISCLSFTIKVSLISQFARLLVHLHILVKKGNGLELVRYEKESSFWLRSCRKEKAETESCISASLHNVLLKFIALFPRPDITDLKSHILRWSRRTGQFIYQI